MEQKKQTQNPVVAFFKTTPGLYILVALAMLAFIVIDMNFSILRSRNVSMLIRVAYYSIAALGFNILLGYGGQISLGHAAFMGLGAYIAAYMTMQLEMSFLLALLVAGIVPTLVGLILGLIALRLERLYLAIATLGLGVTIQYIFQEWTEFTGGFSGTRVSSPELFSARISSHNLLILCVILVLLFALFSYNFLRSKTGRALIAMRGSDHAAQAMGVSLFRYKLVAFAISSFYVGVAGGLYAISERFVYPATWGAELSLDILAMVVIGGLASIGGSIAGAAFLVIIPRLTQGIPFIEGIMNINFILTGLALILVIRFFPEGIYRRAIFIITSLKNRLLSQSKQSKEKVDS
ncbi:branched-chain amino acid ABC transporter permease [Proteinivorax hydrogeniformans]|uniref:Branched-chain amino acid ABC transporter permease n=1 Tax=Proteinivorax hydrogeniformans TaxID=1826727 RepID=A0AAU8HRX8_9FIRM